MACLPLTSGRRAEVLAPPVGDGQPPVPAEVLLADLRPGRVRPPLVLGRAAPPEAPLHPRAATARPCPPAGGPARPAPGHGRPRSARCCPCPAPRSHPAARRAPHTAAASRCR